MKTVLSDTTLLKDSFKIISHLLEEANLEFGKEGMKLRGISCDNVAYVIYDLYSTGFTEFDLKSDLKLGVSFSKLRKIMDRATSSDILEISCSDRDPKKLTFTLKGDRTRKFTIGILDDIKGEKEPELTFSVETSLSSDSFSASIDDAASFAESLLISVNNGLRMLAYSDSDVVEIEFPETVELKFASEKPKAFKSKYSLEYLKKISESKKISDSLQMQMAKDYPLKLIYEQMGKSKMAFILAPRIEE